MIYSNLAGTTSNTFQINDGAKFYKNLLPYNLNWQTNSFPDANIHEITTMGLDLNTIKTPGQYYCVSRDVINSLVNCPVKNEGFLLTVEPSTGNLSTSLNHVHQCLISYKGSIWHRWFGSQGEIFIGWVSVAFSNQVSELGDFMLNSSSTNISWHNTRSYYCKIGNFLIMYISVNFTMNNNAQNPSSMLIFSGFPFPLVSAYGIQGFLGYSGTITETRNIVNLEPVLFTSSSFGLSYNSIQNGTRQFNNLSNNTIGNNVRFSAYGVVTARIE